MVVCLAIKPGQMNPERVILKNLNESYLRKYIGMIFKMFNIKI